MNHHFNPAHFGIRTKDWKLIFFYGTDDRNKGLQLTPPGWELYNMKNDPLEMNNLYNNPEYTAVTEKLKEQFPLIPPEPSKKTRKKR